MKRLICALVIGCMSLHASATWTLNGNTATDGIYTFNIQRASTNVDGEMMLFGATKNDPTTEGELDLTTFYEDTGSRYRIVEVIQYMSLGDILNCTGFIGPDVRILGETSLRNSTSGNSCKMRRIRLSANLERIGKGACAYLHQLTEFYPMDMRCVTEIPTSAFDQCALVGDLKLPLVAKIGETAFRINLNPVRGVAGLTSVDAPLCTEVGTRAIFGQTLVTNILLSSSLAKVGDSAFHKDEKMTTFSPRTCPSLTQVGAAAFANCSLLSGAFDLPACTQVGANAFQNCVLLESITVSQDLTSIGAYAFCGCAKLAEISPTMFPKYTGTVGEYAFADCPLLSGDFDFGGATAVGERAFSFYQTSSLGAPITSVRATNVVSVGERAFFNCRALTNVVVSQTLKSVFAYGFCNCFALEHFEPFLPEGMTDVRYCAFDSCKKLKEDLVWNNPSITSLENNLFSACPYITNVTIRSKIDSFRGTAFSGLADGCCFYWYAEAPDEIVSSPVLAGSTLGYRFYVWHGASDAGWQAWAKDAKYGLPVDKTHPGYPGRRTFGCIRQPLSESASAIMTWLVDFPPPGLMILVR